MSEATGRQEDASYSNLKLAIMALSVLCGCIAQFHSYIVPWYPLAFPANRVLLAVCVVIYFALSAVLQYQMSIHDREFVWSCAAEVSRGGGKRWGGAREMKPSRPWPSPPTPMAASPSLRMAAQPCLCARSCAAPERRPTPCRS